MSLISFITDAWSWFKTKFIDHIKSAAHVAFVITETVKTLLANPVTSFLVNVADSVTHTQIPTDIANAINGLIPKILAVELGIEGLPANPTPQDIQNFENNVMSAFNVNSNNSKLYTTLAAQIYGVIQTTINSGQNNFATWVNAVEQIYADYQKDLSANAPIAATPTPNQPAA